MVSIVFHIHPSEHGPLRRYLAREAELIDLRYLEGDMQQYHIKRTNATFIYDPRGNVVIRANTKESIIRTKSRLERDVGIHIIGRVENGRRK